MHAEKGTEDRMVDQYLPLSFNILDLKTFGFVAIVMLAYHGTAMYHELR